MTRQIRVGGVPIGGCSGHHSVHDQHPHRRCVRHSGADQTSGGGGVRDCAGGGARSGRRPGGGGHSGAEPHPSGGGHPFRLPAGPGCVAAGCDKVRINPGNIGGEDRVKAVAGACRQAGHPHPDRSQRRLPGEAHPGQIRRGDAGGPGGVGLWTYPPAGEI